MKVSVSVSVTCRRKPRFRVHRAVGNRWESYCQYRRRRLGETSSSAELKCLLESHVCSEMISFRGTVDDLERTS